MRSNLDVKQKGKREQSNTHLEQKYKSKSKNGMKTDVGVKQKGKRKRSTTHLEQKCQSNSKRVKQTADQTRCSLCSYGQADDPKKDEVWIQCHTCGHWFHETCAEDYGILDDSVFTCYSCCWQNLLEDNHVLMWQTCSCQYYFWELFTLFYVACCRHCRPSLGFCLFCVLVLFDYPWILRTMTMTIYRQSGSFWRTFKLFCVDYFQACGPSLGFYLFCIPFWC